MTTTGPSQPDPKPQGLFALLWVMLKRMGGLMLTPGADKSIAALWAEIEAVLVQALLQQAQQIDPTPLGIDPADYDIKLTWTKSGLLDFRITPKPHLLVAAKQTYRDLLAYLRKLRLAREAFCRRARWRGIQVVTRFAHGLKRRERRRADRRHCNPSHHRAGAPERVAPLMLVPP